MASEQVYDRNEAAFMGFGLPAQSRDDVLALAAMRQHSASAELRQAVSHWLSIGENADALAAIKGEAAEAAAAAEEAAQQARKERIAAGSDLSVAELDKLSDAELARAEFEAGLRG
jgi:hypothetical protein